MEKKKYFKIVNPEGHNGLVYKEGYNEDPLPFKPATIPSPWDVFKSFGDLFYKDSLVSNSLYFIELIPTPLGLPEDNLLIIQI